MARTKDQDALGKRGEALAHDFLAGLGYTLLDRNWRSDHGEIDLVMRDSDVIVLVEVKTRAGETAGRAEEAITRSKSRKLLSTGEWYMHYHPEFANLFWRCDLVAITVDPFGEPTITHYVNSIVSG